MVEPDLFFECYPLVGVLYTKHFGEKREPKTLTFAFFVAFVFPFSGKVSCGFLLLNRGHNNLLMGERKNVLFLMFEVARAGHQHTQS